MKCSRCQQDNPSHAKFCLECGAPLKSPHESGPSPASYADLQHALTEAFEQQTATSEILGVISRSPTDVQPVFDAIADNAARLCEANDAEIYVVDGSLYRRVAHCGPVPVAGPVGEAYPITRGRPSSRAIIDRQTIQVYDQAAEIETEFPDLKAWQQVAGVRTILATPLLRDGIAIGVIGIRRTEVKPFTVRHIALLETFANQAVIAIENVRLFQELQARNAELTESLEQQTATGAILGVMSGSPTDIQPILDAVAESATRLCDARDVSIALVDGNVLRVVASHGMLARWWPDEGVPINRGSVTGRAVADRQTVHIHDLASESDEEFPQGKVYQRLGGHRTNLAVPLIREGVAIGVIAMRRGEVRPFTDRQVGLLRTFADQAVIAIENVRLFTELEARNRDLIESLEQQTATAEILRVIASSPTDLHPVMATVAENAARVCGATDSSIYRLEDQHLRLVARHGSLPRALTIGDAVPVSRDTVAGRVVCDRRTIHVEDLMVVEAEFPVTVSRMRQAGSLARTMLVTPLLREGTPLGVILIHRSEVHPFSAKQIALLETFANQAVIAIENIRLFRELERRNRDLTEALDQQTATSEILQVISRSPTDLKPVFDAIAAKALDLCRATTGWVYTFDGELIHVAAAHGLSPEGIEVRRQSYPMPPSRGGGTSRAVLSGTIVYIPDIREDHEYTLQPLAKAAAYLSVLAVPMLREGKPIGVITVTGAEAGAFSQRQIELLGTFADQAVIAIENVRLFKELQQRTAELTRSVEQLTALGEVSRAVSSTLDVEAVLDTIVSRASQLAGADGCSIYEYDEGSEQFYLRAAHNLDAAFVEAIRGVPLRKGEGLMGRATEMREPVQVPDITQPEAYRSGVRDALIRFGYRALLSVPLRREDEIIGSLSLNRKAPGAFPPEAIDVLKTFATQSALAIQNARLFREIADKSRQLEAASRHKSEFLANMSHELRTPLNAILGFNEMILGQIYGDVPSALKEPLTDIQNSGKHLLRLINNVLDLSKIEAGRMELALTDYAVQDLVERVRATLQPLAADKGLEFVASVPETIPVAFGDAGRITQCLMNLAGNALKFTHQGRVGISVELQGDLLVYRVADTGIGIAKDKLETVFAEFRQGDATITNEFGGTGLGLSITKKFVEMHGGRIWVDSELGKGATFFFAIPLRLAGGQTA